MLGQREPPEHEGREDGGWPDEKWLDEDQYWYFGSEVLRAKKHLAKLQ